MNDQHEDSSTAPVPGTILIVDDDAGVRNLIGRVAEVEGFRVTACEDGNRVAEMAQQLRPSVITLDLNMPKCNGVEVLRQLARHRVRARISLMSGVDSRMLASARELGETMQLDIARVLPKPFRLSDLRQALANEWQEEQFRTDDTLSTALTRGQMVVHYQPRIERRENDWHITGVESLCRWQHPQRGLVGPDNFIQMAERSGSIVALTDFVVNETLRQLSDWDCQGLSLDASVNISGSMLSDQSLPARLHALVARQGIAAERLTLEVTETATIDKPDVTLAILSQLRSKGFELSMDDFGMGYSPMQHLFNLPFDELKIDKSFILPVAGSERAKTMVSSLIQLAHNLDMRVCAEGIESADVLRFLADAGCDRAQGFLISRALPGQDIVELVCRTRRSGLAHITRKG